MGKALFWIACGVVTTVLCVWVPQRYDWLALMFAWFQAGSAFGEWRG